MKQITTRLKTGQDLRGGIEKLAKENNITAGVLLSAVGGLANARLRMPGSRPGNQIVKEWEGPFEIVSGIGTISSDDCHIHISLSDKNGKVVGGHLRGGCIVKNTAEVVLLVFEGARYKRVFDPATGFEELFVE